MELHFGTKITLSLEDQEMIKNLSASICQQDRSYFVENFKKDKSVKLYQMNLNGFGAELAFCRLSNTSFNFSTNKNENHFKNPDAILFNGLTVDVKNTIYKNGKLIVRTGKENMKVDIYALVTGTFPNFTFSGWKEYHLIIRKELIEDLGWGPAYCLSQEQLNKILVYSK
jgi:hypothetical protein